MNLICPVCAKPLLKNEKCYVCENRHSFDIAKEGYVNLLRNAKNGELIGDNKDMARSRREFLNRGYYSVLRNKLVELLADKNGRLLDICCGEGYYTSAFAENTRLEVMGFDISKEMVRLAAKRKSGEYFVANMADIPIKDGSVDIATHLFAPFNKDEFHRILKPDGILYTVVPAKKHLLGLKSALYEMPYENDENFTVPCGFSMERKLRISDTITLETYEDIDAVFKMTPYYYHTSQEDKNKLLKYNSLTTEIEFLIYELKKI